MVRFVIIVTAFVSVTAVAAPVPKALKKPAVTIEGSWRMQSQESGGQPTPPNKGDYNLWVVDGGTMTLIREDNAGKEGVYPCRFTSETNGDGVRTFEYKVDQNGYHRRGVCELDGDTLRVAFGTDSKTPPKAVKGEGGSGVTLYTFQRVTDSK
jgi:uncharacterized protein (TIGR03067 family)